MQFRRIFVTWPIWKVEKTVKRSKEILSELVVLVRVLSVPTGARSFEGFLIFLAPSTDDLTGSKGTAFFARIRFPVNVVIKSLDRKGFEHILALSDTYKARDTKGNLKDISLHAKRKFSAWVYFTYRVISRFSALDKSFPYDPQMALFLFWDFVE